MSTTAQAAKFPGFDAQRHAITKDRPRLFGSREQMRKLAQERPEAYQRMLKHARGPLVETENELQGMIIGLSLAYALEGNRSEGRLAVELSLKHYIDKQIKEGHMSYGFDMARCAVAYDLCHDLWTGEERARFLNYVHETIAVNVESETSPFHNGWYSYKHWGYGMAAYALMYDDPEAATILKNQERDYLVEAAPALEVAGKGGGWGEGYCIHYFLFEWMCFCEVARSVEGLDYYSAAPEFFKERAVAAMLEFYPSIVQPTPAPTIGKASPVVATEISRRPVPMGDAMGIFVKHERDKTLTTRRIRKP